MSKTILNRSNQLPLCVLWDETVDLSQQEFIKDTLFFLMDSVGFNKDNLHFLGEDLFTDLSNHPSGNNYDIRSIERKIVESMDAERKQVHSINFFVQLMDDFFKVAADHRNVIFTTRDICKPGNEFLIGCEIDIMTLISFHRFEAIIYPTLRKETEKTAIFHEVGHILGLPTIRQGAVNLEEEIGSNCTHPGCSMKQGMDVPYDWIENTVKRLQNGGDPYCKDCILDLDNLATLTAG